MTVDASTFGPAWSATLRRAPEAELTAWLSLAIEMCDEADRLALRWYRREVQTSRKLDRTFVTEADRAIERLIRERILAVHPDHGFVGEEYGEEAGVAAARWYIDPIDGTHNYIRGVPLFGTLLAVEVEGEMQVGVMSAPAMGERWYAARGRGSWAVARDGQRRRLRVSEVGAVEDAHLVYGSRREDVQSGLMPGFDAVIDACWRERGFGDFWGYALVAEGAAEAMFETGIRSWDVAAPMVIIEEAGGRVTDVTGARDVNAASFVGSNGLIHEDLLRRLTASA
ncbi:MAG TPA: inositol monophosphatase family protein [Patescibacteria group bacterium]|nr:inositol monophosphatase family protein [Patescibacteria group bacterium]